MCIRDRPDCYFDPDKEEELMNDGKPSDTLKTGEAEPDPLKSGETEPFIKGRDQFEEYQLLN
eukprot:2445576-Prorocentrum_lima.AAC.1